MDKMKKEIFLHLLHWSLLREERSLFLSGKEKERGGTILSFYPPRLDKTDLQFNVSLF